MNPSTSQAELPPSTQLRKTVFGGSLLLITVALSCSVTVSSQAQEGLPDLTIDANRLQSSVVFQLKTFSKNSCAVQEGCVSGTGKRTLMRFSTTTPNIGAADLELGAPATHPELFTYSACHGHFHFEGYASYELLNQAGNVLVVGRKQAFCLLDFEKWDSNAGPPRFTCSYQGISAGWADTYGSHLDCQWLDITGVPPGQYWLRVTIDPQRRLKDANFSNNSAKVPVTIPSKIR